MINDDLWTADGPTASELKVLDRLGARRRALEAIEPEDEHQAHILARLLATLDDMEECLCEEGPDAHVLNEGWHTLDALEERLSEVRPSGTPIAHPQTRSRLTHGPEDPCYRRKAA